MSKLNSKIISKQPSEIINKQQIDEESVPVKLENQEILSIVEPIENLEEKENTQPKT